MVHGSCILQCEHSARAHWQNQLVSEPAYLYFLTIYPTICLRIFWLYLIHFPADTPSCSFNLSTHCTDGPYGKIMCDDLGKGAYEHSPSNFQSNEMLLCQLTSWWLTAWFNLHSRPVLHMCINMWGQSGHVKTDASHMLSSWMERTVCAQ